MNRFLESYIKSTYGLDINNCSEEQLSTITEIILSDVTDISQSEIQYDWDFSDFPNLKNLDCSYNHIESINVRNNMLLEKIRWEGVRGNFSAPLDLSHNCNLKKVIGGQDGLIELDFSHNLELEEIDIHLSSSLRWINVNNCNNLKRICLLGVNIPFVDLTSCPKLEYCDIHYLNLYRNQRDEYGDGYPRPIIFVNSNFNENIIPVKTRQQSYYSYYLVRTKNDSAESRFLSHLKSNKNFFTSILPDNRGREVARLHYKLLDELENFRKKE